ncbi:MAG TPA: DegV family protein [Anaerolineaceae bacterium]|nr:DegV family protein [Anaerolineaceae bacterium]HQP08513.1 DegV family protein [Anaerolineaceae bacterium]
MVHILTDSVSDLGHELPRKFDIGVIPLSVFVNEQTFIDGGDLTSEMLYAEVGKSGQLPKTAAPSVAEFINFFSSYPEDILFISIGSSLSATNQNAILAVEALPERNIRIIDSKNLSTGIGLLVLAAAEKRNQGAALDEIYDYVMSLIPRVNSSFMIDTLEYLHKGGRCSAMENLMGSLLSIHPIIEVRQDGTLGVRQKLRGTGKKVMDTMIDGFRQNLDRIDLHRVFITHSGGGIDPFYIKQKLEDIAEIEEICITQAGATVSSHCGPKTIGILYIMKE